MAIVEKRVSTRVRLTRLSLLAGIAMGISTADLANAEEKRKKSAEVTSTSAAKTVRTGASQKVATQKLMRNLWEKAHKGPDVASSLPRARN
jgi:hypothetical protein